MNFNVYLFQNCSGIYSQYPNDYISPVIQTHLNQIYGNGFIIRREGALIHYIYSIPVTEGELGICLIFNNSESRCPNLLKEFLTKCLTEKSDWTNSFLWEDAGGELHLLNRAITIDKEDYAALQATMRKELSRDAYNIAPLDRDYNGADSKTILQNRASDEQILDKCCRYNTVLIPHSDRGSKKRPKPRKKWIIAATIFGFLTILAAIGMVMEEREAEAIFWQQEEENRLIAALQDSISRQKMVLDSIARADSIAAVKVSPPIEAEKPQNVAAPAPKKRSGDPTVRIPVQRNGLWGYNDGDGQNVIPAEYLQVWEFNKDGIAMVLSDKGYNFINRSGKKLSSLFFDEANDFCQGYAMVKRGGRWGFMEASGIVRNDRYQACFPTPQDCKVCIMKKDGQWGFTDRGGNECQSPGFIFSGVAEIKRKKLGKGNYAFVMNQPGGDSVEINEGGIKI